MKFDRKAIALNVLTLGFTGAKASNQTIKRIKSRRSAPALSEVAGLIYLIPAYAWISFFFSISDLLGVRLFADIIEELEYSIIGTVVGAFLWFSLVHLILGISLLQHLEEQKEGHRARIIWFGCYGLKWNPVDHLKEDRLEQAVDGNG